MASLLASHKKRFLQTALTLLLPLFPVVAHAEPTSMTFKVKIEATELDKKLLLKYLNHRDLRFELADTNYDFKIIFSTEQRSNGSLWSNTSMATADVFDKANVELFKFNRQGRDSDAEAADDAAKEIINRLKTLKRLTHQP